MPKPPYVLGLLHLSAILAGCVAPSPARRPAEFPRHTPGDFVTVHWQLAHGDRAVTATGVLAVQVRPADRLASVTLELLGTDGSGRVVSRRAGVVYPAAFDATRPWPFTIHHRLTGPEREYAVRVASVAWRDDRSGQSR